MGYQIQKRFQNLSVNKTHTEYYCIAHRNYKTVRDLFTVEDKYHSNTVYNIQSQCDGCNKCYIGETERHKEGRMVEHAKSLGKNEIQISMQV